jgi:Holliday junction resolvasome RuvABC endonuclease subunit
MPLLVLGIDPGFANLGWVLVELDGAAGKEVLLDMGLVTTEKSAKKQNVLASNDNYRRAREISRALRALPRPRVICCEAMSFPRSSSAAAKVAMTWGVVADYCESEGVAMLMASPKELKHAVCQNAGASKSDVQKALRLRFGARPAELLTAAGVPASGQEHPYDALAAVVACLNSETLTLLRSA